MVETSIHLMDLYNASTVSIAEKPEKVKGFGEKAGAAERNIQGALRCCAGAGRAGRKTAKMLAILCRIGYAEKVKIQALDRACSIPVRERMPFAFKNLKKGERL